MNRKMRRAMPRRQAQQNVTQLATQPALTIVPPPAEGAPESQTDTTAQVQPADQAKQSNVYKIELLIEHYPALNRWMQEKNDENLVALFNVVYPGAGKLPLAQFIPMLSSFRVALDDYFKQTQGGTK